MRQQRKAARVAVVDPESAIFMFRYSDAEAGRHWVMPGGGLEGTESFREAALRELAEETGWDDLQPTSLLWTWETNFTHLGIPTTQREYIYLAYGPRRNPIGDLEAAHAADEILEWRWWTLAELSATTEAIWPPQLADLLLALRADGPPPHPIDLGQVS